MIAPNARRLGRADRLAVDGDLVIARHQYSGRGQDAAVHRHLAQTDQPFDLTTRGDARAGHGLGDSFGAFGALGLGRGLVARLAPGAVARLAARLCALVEGLSRAFIGEIAGTARAVVLTGAGLLVVVFGMAIHDEQFMSMALDLAQAAAEAGEVPVGAVIVDENRRSAWARAKRAHHGP